MGCVVDVVRGVLASIKGGNVEKVGDTPVLVFFWNAALCKIVTHLNP